MLVSFTGPSSSQHLLKFEVTQSLVLGPLLHPHSLRGDPGRPRGSKYHLFIEDFQIYSSSGLLPGTPNRYIELSSQYFHLDVCWVSQEVLTLTKM